MFLVRKYLSLVKNFDKFKIFEIQFKRKLIENLLIIHKEDLKILYKIKFILNIRAKNNKYLGNNMAASFDDVIERYYYRMGYVLA